MTCSCLLFLVVDMGGDLVAEMAKGWQQKERSTLSIQVIKWRKEFLDLNLLLFPHKGKTCSHTLKSLIRIWLWLLKSSLHPYLVPSFVVKSRLKIITIWLVLLGKGYTIRLTENALTARWMMTCSLLYVLKFRVYFYYAYYEGMIQDVSSWVWWAIDDQHQAQYWAKKLRVKDQIRWRLKQFSWVWQCPFEEETEEDHNKIEELRKKAEDFQQLLDGATNRSVDGYITFQETVVKELEKRHPGQNFDWVRNLMPGQSFFPSANEGGWRWRWFWWVASYAWRAFGW